MSDDDDDDGIDDATAMSRPPRNAVDGNHDAPLSVIGHGILVGKYLAEYRDSLI